MNPAEIASALDDIRSAGEALRQRSARSVHESLCEFFAHWSNPLARGRRELEAALPGATGLHPKTAREGLDRGLNHWDAAAFRGLVDRELGPEAPVAIGLRSTAVLLAGEIPMPSLLSIVAPLALRSPVVVKSGSRDPVTATIVQRSLASVAPDLAPALCVLPPIQSSAALAALLEADCIVATGSDATIATIGAQLRPTQRFVAAGHRFSIAVIGDEALRANRVGDIAERLAIDIAMWDQQGCLSPIAIFAISEDPHAADRLSEHLAQALANAEAQWPLGHVDDAAAARLASERAEAEMRSASDPAVTLLSDPEHRFAVVREADARMRPAPLHRFVRVHPQETPAALLAWLRPFAQHLAAVALAGFGRNEAPFANALVEAGASRVCVPGTLQAPPIDWRHEGRGVLAPLACFADVEI